MISLLFYCIDFYWVTVHPFGWYHFYFIANWDIKNQIKQTQIFTGSPCSHLSNIAYFIVFRFSGSHWTHLSNITFISLHWHFWGHSKPIWVILHLLHCSDIFLVTVNWAHLSNITFISMHSHFLGHSQPIWVISLLFHCIDIFWVTVKPFEWKQFYFISFAFSRLLIAFWAI